MANLFDYTEFNLIIETEANKCLDELRSASGNNKIILGLRKMDGIIYQIHFKFPKYLIYLEKGASRGHGGRVGSHWKSAKDITISTNPQSLGKMNTGGRSAKPWFNPTIKAFVETMNVLLTDYFVTLSFSRLKLK